MGRQAKLRKQRQQAALSDKGSGSKQPASGLSAKASSLAKKPEPEPPNENKSFLGKLTSWLNPFAKADKYQACIDASNFSEENQELLAAISWEGYQKQGKGLVLVRESDEESPQIDYMPRKLLKKTMREYGVVPGDTKVIENMIEVYDPKENMVTAYVNKNGEMSASMTPTLEPKPPECYRMMQEKKKD